MTMMDKANKSINFATEIIMMNFGKKLVLFLLLIAGGMEFVSASEARAKTATTRKKYFCRSCREIFSKDTLFKLHLKIHPLVCNTCGQAFDDDTIKFDRHRRRHTNEEAFNCFGCDCVCSGLNHFAEHDNAISRPIYFPAQVLAPEAKAPAHTAVQAKRKCVAAEVVNDDDSDDDSSNDAEAEVTIKQPVPLKKLRATPIQTASLPAPVAAPAPTTFPVPSPTPAQAQADYKKLDSFQLYQTAEEIELFASDVFGEGLLYSDSFPDTPARHSNDGLGAPAVENE